MSQPERIAEDLEKPLLDDRSYRVIRLPNRLEALLVHDSDTDKASASVNVNVGNFCDAEDMPGMAHAVEHLLFMGTEKFPSENEYNVYLNSHSGYSNAYTAATETNYYFECAASNGPTEAKDTKGMSNGATATSEEKGPLYGALDRFAQFFVAPLFLESTLDRELRAVDSENKKNLQNDQWRLSQLSKSIANPEHPYHKFSTGNLKTLRDEPLKRDVKIREAFMSFYDKHYSANRMKLVVLGRESLDELEKWVTEFFSGVKNKDLAQNRWDGIDLYTKDQVSSQVFAKPVMESRSLEMYFPYRDEEEMFETQPSRYLSHLIGHEGPGSILAFLKEKGWAHGLSSGGMPLCPGSAFFTISIKLTPEGFKSYQAVVKSIFQYVSLMQESPPQQWIFDEMKDMAEVDFRFRQKSPASRFTSRMSSVMQKTLPRSWLLSGSKMRKFDPTAIAQAMQFLRPDNFRMIIVNQDYTGGWDLKERWYGTDYKVEKIPTDFSSELGQALRSKPDERPAELHLPHKNEFIPNRLSVEKKEVEEPAKAPRLIRNDDSVRLWYKKDDTFWVPKGSVVITLRNPLAYSTPANYVKTSLFCMLVQDALSEYSYDAEISGLDYSLSGSLTGLNIHVHGYNDKMSVLLEKVLIGMRDLQVRQDRFDVIKERLQRSYNNWEYQQPFHLISAFTRWLAAEHLFIKDEYASELKHIDASDVRSFFPQLLAQAHLEVLANGNFYKEDALTMTQLVESTLKSRPLPQSQWSIKRNTILPAGSDFTYQRQLKDPANVNHCIEYVLQVGAINNRDLRAKLQLFSQMTDEPAFNQLRTKEQLGYVVWSGIRTTATTMGYRVIIQSEQPAPYLESRITAFLSRFGEELDKMSEEEFESHRRSLINRRIEKLKNLESESSRFNGHIESEYFDFYQVDEDVAQIRTLSKPDVVSFFNHFISPKSAERAKLSVHLVAAAKAPAATEGITEEQKTKFSDTLVQILGAAGASVHPEKVNEAFQSVDIAGTDQESMLSAVKKLVQDVLPAEQVTAVLEQGKQILPQVLASLGIKKPTKEAALEPEGSVTKPTTLIEDVHLWKAGLKISEGARPVTDLSDFEEIEPKL